MRKSPPPIVSTQDHPFTVATEYHHAERQQRRQRRSRRITYALILFSLVLACIGHLALGLAGYKIHCYTQGDLTVRAYGTSDGFTPKGTLYYDDGSSYSRTAPDQWEGEDGSLFSGCMQNGFFLLGTHTTAAYTYTGTFFANRPNGEGEIRYPDGSRYQGGFAFGTLEGKGTLTYPDGSYYIGSFADGKRHGEGAHYQKDGTLLRIVTYEKDIPMPS